MVHRVAVVGVRRRDLDEETRREAACRRQGRNSAVSCLVLDRIPDLGTARQMPDQVGERQDLVADTQRQVRSGLLDEQVGGVDLLTVDDGDVRDAADEGVVVRVVVIQVEKQRVGGQALVGAVIVCVKEVEDRQQVLESLDVLSDEVGLARHGGGGDSAVGAVDNVAGHHQVVGLVDQ